ncbi:hypothetical protein K2173_012623 [Erythroxylum novogranatense]|uniref:NADP-dependent oxidoreductase domain-containing protein n=1 Tax=Erythroxylum novogranatense TaxID=1862640 RepID=A0AAV8S7Q0_9ROSI|nr:hypothetical protein K2173_012623 [Erythroxylum novogranatense]
MKNSQVRLNCGITMPVLGLGTYSFENDRDVTEQAVHAALKMGYRHFDTAKIYGSEPAVGSALTEAILNQVVDRDDVFVTSKLWSSDHSDPVAALKRTLKNLGMQYLDMYLVHWPVKLKPWACYPLPNEEDFEKLDLDWAYRCIGVSNFSSKKIQWLSGFASVTPAVNQVANHLNCIQNLKGKELGIELSDYRIHVSAYSPLGGPGNSWGSTAVVENPIIQSIAYKHNATPAQVPSKKMFSFCCPKWGLSKGSSVIVKSFNQSRMKENMGHLTSGNSCNHTTSPYRTLEDLWDDEI